MEFNTILNIIGFNVKLIKRKAPENFPGLFYLKLNYLFNYD
ncbi:protein of unknown function [Chryseobacterium sp. JV274]|nr:protein of unknown function [Chryseobacterium sp. JV274]